MVKRFQEGTDSDPQEESTQHIQTNCPLKQETVSLSELGLSDRTVLLPPGLQQDVGLTTSCLCLLCLFVLLLPVDVFVDMFHFLFIYKTVYHDLIWL